MYYGLSGVIEFFAIYLHAYTILNISYVHVDDFLTIRQIRQFLSGQLARFIDKFVRLRQCNNFSERSNLFPSGFPLFPTIKQQVHTYVSLMRFPSKENF